MSNTNKTQCSNNETREYQDRLTYTGYNETEDGKSKTQFSSDQIKEFNSFCIKNYDKWNRMFDGISSHIKLYEDNIIQIIVDNSETKYDSTKELAVQFINRWIGHLKRHTSLKPDGYVVYLYSTNKSPGFIYTKNTPKKEKLIATTKTEEKKELAEILSGRFSRSEK